MEEHKLLNPDWAEVIRRKSTMYKTPMDTPDDGDGDDSSSSKPWKNGEQREGSGRSPKAEKEEEEEQKVTDGGMAVGPMEAVARNIVLDGMKKRAKAAPSRFVGFWTC